MASVEHCKYYTNYDMKVISSLFIGLIYVIVSLIFRTSNNILFTFIGGLIASVLYYIFMFKMFNRYKS